MCYIVEYPTEWLTNNNAIYRTQNTHTKKQQQKNVDDQSIINKKKSYYF